MFGSLGPVGPLVLEGLFSGILSDCSGRLGGPTVPVRRLHGSFRWHNYCADMKATKAHF